MGCKTKFVQTVLFMCLRWLPLYGKNSLKIFFSEPGRLLNFKLGIQHQGLGHYKVCSNDEPGLTLNYLTKVNFAPLCFCMGKCLSTTIEVYELKVSTDSWLSTWIHNEYQRSRSLFDFYFQTYSQAVGHVKVKFHVEPLWSGGTKVCSNDGGYIAKVAAICG